MGGLEKVVGRLDEDRVRLDEAPLLSAEFLRRCVALLGRLAEVLYQSALDLFLSAEVVDLSAKDLLLSPKVGLLSAKGLLLLARENPLASRPLLPI